MPGRTTAVVTNVVVAADLVTPVNAASTPLNPTASASGTATGTATLNTFVRVLQPLPSTLKDGAITTVELSGRFVDGDTGSYSYPLVVNAPLVAPYVTTPGALVFADDAAAAGKYSLNASLTGFADKTTVLPTLTANTTVQTNVTFP